MEENLKEMLGKRPDELEEETLKLFNAIMKIADERDELESKCKELEEENKIIKGNYYTLSEDIQMVTTELGFPEDTIIADEMIPMIKEEYIEKSLVEEKIEEYFEDEEWLVEHDLRALCDDEKECREYYTNKKLALKDIKKAILDKLNKLLKNY